MSIGTEDLADMAAMAERGELGSQIDPVVEFAADSVVARGREGVVSWKVAHAARVVLRVVSPNGVATEEAVVHAGSQRLRFNKTGMYRIVLRATPLPARSARRRRNVKQAVAVVSVEAPKPTAQIRTARAIGFRDPLSIVWTTTEADRVQLTIDGESRPVDPQGDVVIQLGDCGRHMVALVAEGEGGLARCEREVQVVAPPVKIFAVAAIETEFGRPARIDYRITGARAACVDLLDARQPPRPIRLSGYFEVEAWLEPERIRIIAEGFDGRHVVHTITVFAKAFALPPIADELATFSNRLPSAPCISDELAFLSDWRS